MPCGGVFRLDVAPEKTSAVRKCYGKEKELENTIRIIGCKIGKEPYVAYITNTEERMREFVGGDLINEIIAEDEGIKTVIVRGKGQKKVNDSTPCAGLKGNCFIVRYDGQYLPLTNKDVFFWLKHSKARFNKLHEVKS